MDISLNDLKQLISNSTASQDHPYELGKNYVIRTVTMIYTGRLVEVWPQEIVLVDAAWIPETERYADFIEKGLHKECEPYPNGHRVLVGRGAISDATVLPTNLPRSQK